MPIRTTQFVHGNYYHIFNRGVNRERVFVSGENYCYLQQLLPKYSSQKEIGIVCYCLMPTHYHFLLCQNDGGTISEFVNTLFNAYVQAFNKQQRRRGPLFEGRFRHVHVGRQEYLLHLMRYIHLNPVMAGLVKKPEDWRFSDYGLWAANPVNLPRVGNPREVERFRTELGIPSHSGYKEFVMDYLNSQEIEIQLQKYLFQ